MESNGVIEQMNLWMNIFPASTTLHYDANNNILVVLEGQKEVTLFAPSATKFLKPAAAHNEYPNHSALTPEEADQLVDSLRTDATEATDCLAYSVTLSAGDALFIPEGWWHQVRSQKCTMALNFWFHSDLRPLLVLPSEVEPSDGTIVGVDMSSYLLRSSLRKAVAAQKLTGNQKKTKQEHSASSYPDNLTFDQFCHYAHECLSLSKNNEEAHTAVGSKRKQSTADPWTDFVDCDIQTMRKFWIPFANAHPQQWTELLLSLSPAAADHLLSYWDTLEDDGTAEGEVSDEKFFHDIFSPCGDAVPEVRQYLIAQKDKNNEIYAMQVLRNILGIEERDMA
eukprot:gene23342-26420_t